MNWILRWLRAIDLRKAVDNSERKFGADLRYYHAWVRDEDGITLPALFTLAQVQQAIVRASKNPEDLP